MTMARPEFFQRVCFTGATANASATVNVPPGQYIITAMGDTTNGSNDSTVALTAFTNAAQTKSAPIHGAVAADTAYTAAVVVPANGFSIAYAAAGDVATLPGVHGIAVPHGLSYAYVENTGTAANLTLWFYRIG